MITLKKYLMENIAIATTKHNINKAAVRKRIEAFLLFPDGHNNLIHCPVDLISSRHKKEYMRGYFASADDEDTVINNITIMLTKMFEAANENINDVELEYGNYRIASGQYRSMRVKSKVKKDINIKQYNFNLPANDCIYIINTAIGKSKIKPKTLTPKALDLAQNTYTNSNDLIKDVVEALNNKKLGEYIPFLLALCKGLCTNENNTTCEELVEYTKTGNELLYSISMDNIPGFNDLSPTDISNIENDFGEILGPIMFMNKLNSDVVISYPAEINSKTFDYHIDKEQTVKISAKSKKGSATTIVDLMQPLKAYFEAHDEDVSSDFIKIVNILADNSSNKENPSYIRRQLWELAFELEDKDIYIKNGLDVLRTKFNLNNSGIKLSDLNNLKRDEIVSFLNKFYTAINYTHVKTTPEYIESIYTDIESDSYKQLHEGMLTYPIKVAVTKYIKKNYTELINTYANKALYGYQLDFNIKTQLNTNSVLLKFKLKDRKNCNCVITTEGSVYDPYLKSIGYKLV
jgi:hypothetical protein